MRTVHVTPYFAPAYRFGGPPRSIHGLCRGLLDSGVEVEVLTTAWNGASELPSEVTEREEFDEVPVRYLPRSWPRRLIAASGIGRALGEALTSADLVHLHGLWNAPVWRAALACMRMKVPYVVSPRGMLDDGSFAHHRWRKDLCYWGWEKRYLRRARFLHVTSASEAAGVARRNLGAPIANIPNGVAPGTPLPRERVRESLGVGSDDGLVLYLGRLHATKRLDLLVAATERARRLSASVRLVLAGPRDGLDLDRLLNGASGFVSVLGEVAEPEKWSLLSAADLLVLCSDSESFGMSIVEALAVGTPVVATKTCPWEEVAREGCGFWVDQNADDIGDAIVRMLRDKSEARAMGERGKALVEKRYRWSAIADEMAARYRSALSGRV